LRPVDDAAPRNFRACVIDSRYLQT